MHTSFSFYVVLITFLLTTSGSVCAATAGSLTLPSLPYDDTALEPFISQQTLQIHHGKHHAKYVATTNSMILGTKFEGMSLEDIIMKTFSGRTKDQTLFNNAAQSWNHAFYWKCMKPNGGGEPSTKTEGSRILLQKIESSFGSFDAFQKEFREAGNTAFGSGWAWLVYHKKGKKLSVMKTIGADNPMTSRDVVIPLLCMDVWEHAYYLDYQNLRPTYVDTFLNSLVNWDFVQENLERAMETGRGAEL